MDIHSDPLLGPLEKTPEGVRAGAAIAGLGALLAFLLSGEDQREVGCYHDRRNFG